MHKLGVCVAISVATCARDHDVEQWLETTSVAFAEKWSRKMAAAMQHASTALHPENDIMVVRAANAVTDAASVVATLCLGANPNPISLVVTRRSHKAAHRYVRCSSPRCACPLRKPA